MAINRDKVLETAQKYVDRKRYDRAVAELRKLIEADPNDARTLLKIGDLQARQNLHADAIGTYDSVGKLYASQGFSLKAIAVYKQIREIIAKHVPQLEERYGHIAPKLAELYQQLGLTSDALAALDEVATRLQRQQRDEEAIEVFRKIVELDPTNPLPHLRLAEALSRISDVDGAVDEFKIAASQLSSIGRRDDAIKVLERLLHHKPDPEQAKTCAELYLSRGQAQDGMQALAKLQICFQADPRDFDTLSLLARAFTAIGQGAKAIEVQKEMARVARDTGKTDLFREILERLLRVAPHDEGVRRLAQQSGNVPALSGYAETEAEAERAPIAPPAPVAVAPPPPPPHAASAPARPPPPPPPRAEARQEPAAGYPAAPPRHAPVEAHEPVVYAYEEEIEELADVEIVEESDVYVEHGEAYLEHDEAYAEHGAAYAEHGEAYLDASEQAHVAEHVQPSAPHGAHAYAEPEYVDQGSGPGAHAAGAHDAAAYEHAEHGSEAHPGYAGHGYDAGQSAYEHEQAGGAYAPDAQAAGPDIHTVLADADAFRRVRLYARALETLSAGFEMAPRSLELHETYRDVLLEAGQTEDAVQTMLAIAGLYVDALDGESAARALQDVLAFDPTNAHAIDMLQELGYEVVDEHEAAGHAPGAHEAEDHRLPSYDLEEMGPADVSASYADDRQIHLRPQSFDDDLGDQLPSFPLDDAADDVALEPHASHHASGPFSAPMAPPSAPPSSIGSGARHELEEALDEAEFFCSRGLFDDARAIVDEQLAKHPHHPLLHERLAEIEALELERGSGAREKPLYDETYDIKASLDALESLDYVDLQPAEGHAQGGEQVDVEEVFAKFKEGVAKQISVDDSESRYNLGIAYKEMQLLDDAIREFDLAAMDPKRECVCRSMIGMIHIERGNLNAAIEAFLQGLNAAIKDASQETMLCFEIGAAYEAKKMNSEALAYYQKAMRRDPNYRDVQERVRRLAKTEPKQNVRQLAAGADDEFDRAFDDLLSKA